MSVFELALPLAIEFFPSMMAIWFQKRSRKIGSVPIVSLDSRSAPGSLEWQAFGISSNLRGKGMRGRRIWNFHARGMRGTRYYMEKSSRKSTIGFCEGPGTSLPPVGYLIPAKVQKPRDPDLVFATNDGYLVLSGSPEHTKAYLDGTGAADAPLQCREYCIWDTHLSGFGMRVRPSGKRLWFVRLRERGKQRRVGLGEVAVVPAHDARLAARRYLAQGALDGLPRRRQRKDAPSLAHFYDDFWQDRSRNWKPSTQKRNHQAWRRYILPDFGDARVSAITRGDVERWRDSFAGEQEAIFNRTIPVLAAIMAHAELYGHRKKGSNPCRGMPRYRRQAKERFLSPAEYRRLASALAADEATHPLRVALVRLLLFTGARYNEIGALEW